MGGFARSCLMHQEGWGREGEAETEGEREGWRV